MNKCFKGNNIISNISIWFKDERLKITRTLDENEWRNTANKRVTEHILELENWSLTTGYNLSLCSGHVEI